VCGGSPRGRRVSRVCGIAGFLSPDSSSSAEDLAATAMAMGRAIAHRGPDDCSVWADAQRGLALAHPRLSVIDLSPDGHQPMTSPSGRLVAVFNGETYNYLELRTAQEQRSAQCRAGIIREFSLDRMGAEYAALWSRAAGNQRGA